MSRSFSPEPHNSNFLSRLYLSNDTIAAISSGLGGAIALLRISGPAARGALKSISHVDPPPEKTVRLTKLFDPVTGTLLDEALAVCFHAPRSFTGEDVVELNLHGSPFIAARLLEFLAQLGVRQALPGEFSFRAIRNGKTTLTQAQAVSDLIGASNESAVTLALEKMSGSQNALVKSVAEDLRTLATLGEVGIDFSDQDVEEVGLPALRARAKSIFERLDHLEKSYERGNRIQSGVRVAFVGLPNAGKSSFFNALLGEDRSIVSEVAGTTRDVIREKLNLRSTAGSITLRLEDTAGLRHTTDSIEIQGIARSQEAAKNAEIVVFIVDPASPLKDVEKQWAELIALCSKDLPIRTLGILTKTDIHPGSSPKLFESVNIKTWVVTSANTGEGIPQAIEALISLCNKLVHRQKGEVLLTRLDHLKAVQDASNHLKRSLGASDIDLFASDVRQALVSLAPLIGDTLPDDILGKIFSDFCIGK